MRTNPYEGGSDHTSFTKAGVPALLWTPEQLQQAFGYFQQYDANDGVKDIEAAIKPDDAHFARTRLLALENTWGGKVLPAAYVEQATALARRKGLATHLDGARLANAVAAGFDLKSVAKMGVDILVMGGTKAGSTPTEAVIFLNPVLELGKDKDVDEEGCLSFPDLRANVKRSAANNSGGKCPSASLITTKLVPQTAMTARASKR